MATYAVGDLQGCIGALRSLLEKVAFDPGSDCLWCAGDLVNRGPDSLATLRFIKNLPNTRVVLGNHDLHLLAAARGHKRPSKKDTLDDILDADDRDELLDWLQQQPLVYRDKTLGFTMVHAGIPPMWSVEDALGYAAEVENILRSDKADRFFQHMYGNEPDHWHSGLEGPSRLRVITNYFTRMRFCSAAGHLELETKSTPDDAPDGYAPWFTFPNHRCKHERLLFGHWAALEGRCSPKNFYALDTGCVWGGALTLMRLEDASVYRVDCDC